MESLEFTYIDQAEQLDELIAQLKGEPEVFLDTEADNLHHYATRVCLLQFRVKERNYLVDPLSDLDLSALFESLKEPTLVMHGSDFDLRLLAEMAVLRPTDVFDTMFAAQLLGVSQIGLAALLKEFLDVDHPKDSQKSDWSQRPLTPKMLHYAAGDVEYLPQLKAILHEKLSQLGRLDWHKQKCDRQIEAASNGFGGSDQDAWRISHSQKLSPQGRAALYELWHWREEEAKRIDRPPFKVLHNRLLLELSQAVAEKRYKEALEKLPKGIKRRWADSLADVLEKGAQRDPETLPSRKGGKRQREAPLTQEEVSRQDSLKARRDKISEDLKIEPTLILTRAQMAKIARSSECAVELCLPWQVQLMEL
ncbi:MAG: HRDC domain-containing protein [Opitutaceae bacterium]|nr:HRDC domain-containing protein [Opitutaceae bacterium]